MASGNPHGKTIGAYGTHHMIGAPKLNTSGRFDIRCNALVMSTQDTDLQQVKIHS